MRNVILTVLAISVHANSFEDIGKKLDQAEDLRQKVTGG